MTTSKLFLESPPRSSLGAFRAKISVALESVPAWRASIADSGLSSSVLFATYCPDMSSWRMSQRSLFEGWAELSETWPQSGMTRSGQAYRLPLSVPLTYELASGFLPTPVATDTGHRRTQYSQGGWQLSTAVGGPTNPEYLAWMMGFPPQWSSVEDTGTLSSPRSQRSSGG